MEGYIETGFEADLADSLEMAFVFLESSQTDSRYWKWFVLALHSSVQGTAALALEHGNGLLIQKPGVMKRIIESRGDNAQIVERYMDKFTNLVEKTGRNEMLRQGAVPLEDNGHVSAMRVLNDIREDFVHFNINSWMIGIQNLLKLAQHGVECICHYARDTPAILWHEESCQKRANAAIVALRDKLAVLSVSNNN